MGKNGNEKVPLFYSVLLNVSTFSKIRRAYLVNEGVNEKYYFSSAAFDLPVLDDLCSYETGRQTCLASCYSCNHH